MSNIRIHGATLDDNYTLITVYIKMKDNEPEKRIYIRYQQGDFVFKSDSYAKIKELYKILDTLRGFMADKRNFKIISKKLIERINIYNENIRNTSDMSDIKYYFKCQEFGLRTLDALAQKMGMSENVTKEMRENLERNKAEAGVTE